MPPERTSTSEAPAMTQAAIKKLVADSVFGSTSCNNGSIRPTYWDRTSQQDHLDRIEKALDQ
ncbi:hypothetical protein Tco_0041547, partial [Tanacetum coccineum]